MKRYLNDRTSDRTMDDANPATRRAAEDEAQDEAIWRAALDEQNRAHRAGATLSSTRSTNDGHAGAAGTAQWRPLDTALAGWAIALAAGGALIFGLKELPAAAPVVTRAELIEQERAKLSENVTTATLGMINTAPVDPRITQVTDKSRWWVMMGTQCDETYPGAPANLVERLRLFYHLDAYVDGNDEPASVFVNADEGVGLWGTFYHSKAICETALKAVNR
jgi:hypothetical protein